MAKCPHGKSQQNCHRCNPQSRRCVHDKRWEYCRICTPDSRIFCQHGRQRNNCRECGTKRLCVHTVGKYYCRICHPQCLCPHGHRRYNCKTCFGLSDHPTPCEVRHYCPTGSARAIQAAWASGKAVIGKDLGFARHLLTDRRTLQKFWYGDFLMTDHPQWGLHIINAGLPPDIRRRHVEG